MSRNPVRPRHLKPQTAKWWAAVVKDWNLEDHHIKLLTLAAESWDRVCAARKVLDKEGMTFIDRWDQPKARPEIAIERDSRIAFARLIRELDLDTGQQAASRPPGLASNCGA